MKCGNGISRKRISCIVLAVFTILSAALGGCGKEELIEVVELHEPEQMVMGTETVERRNLYNADIYEASIFPYAENYSFEERCSFGSYGVVVGEKVKKGDPLAYADLDAVRLQIEAAEERLQVLTQDYEEYCLETAEKLREWEERKKRAEEILENLENQKPNEYIPAQNEEREESSDTEAGKELSVVDVGGSVVPEEDSTVNQGSGRVPNPEYARWLADKKEWEGEAALCGYYIDVAEEELRQRAQLYALDYAYYDSRWKELKAEEQKGILVSQMNGTVISMSEYLPGDMIRKGNTVMTVGDLDRKTIKCSAISNIVSLLQHAQETYAFFGGRRYEIAYQENDAEGYSVFSFQEDAGVSVGDYGVVVLVMESRTQVPTLSAEAIYTNGVQKYVYVQESGRSVARQVVTGISDGNFTEILSGIDVGEEVLLAQGAEKASGNTAVLERGTYRVSYSGSGGIYYPRKTLVTNPIQSGTVFFQKLLTEVRQYVEKGDAVLSVRVESDELELYRLETALKRARERLADLTAGDTAGKEDDIAQREKQIAGMEEEIAALREDYAQTAIRTPVSGIVDSCMASAVETAIGPGQTVAQVSDVRSGYLVLNTYLLNYGDMLTVTYRDRSGESHTVSGRVVTMGPLPSGGRYKVQDMLVALPDGEDAVKIAEGLYLTDTLRAEGFVKIMENVVLVPKAAVTVKDEHTYVKVVREDGSTTTVGFLAGGSNADYYWVIEGLTEGMTICWE